MTIFKLKLCVTPSRHEYDRQRVLSDNHRVPLMLDESGICLSKVPALVDDVL